MINFKTLFNSKESVKESVKEVIEQIHSEFNNAGEELLKEANEILSGKFCSEKADRLEKMGFTSTKEVVEIKEKKAKKELSESIISFVQYYRFNYPNYKFITEDMVEQICKKYGLVCGGISKYKGFVPVHNLKHIEDFKLRPEDLLYGRVFDTFRWREDRVDIITKEQYDELNNRNKGFGLRSIYRTVIIDELKICAPIKDMNTDGMRLSGWKLIDIPDPVVLKQVAGGYLILTAWGDEAADPLVVNQINN